MELNKIFDLEYYTNRYLQGFSYGYVGVYESSKIIEIMIKTTNDYLLEVEIPLRKENVIRFYRFKKYDELARWTLPMQDGFDRIKQLICEHEWNKIQYEIFKRT